MDEDNISRTDALTILLELKCQWDNKRGLPELEMLIWEELTDRFDGILDEIAAKSCPDQIPEVFAAFFERLNW